MPIIVVTALNDKELRIKDFQLGSKEFITKPINKDDLVTKVNNIFKAKREMDIIAKYNSSLSKGQNKTGK